MPRPVPEPTRSTTTGQQRQQATPASNSDQLEEEELTPRSAKLRGLAPLPQKFLQRLPGSDEDDASSSEYEAEQGMSETASSDEEEDLSSLGAGQLRSALDSEVRTALRV